MNITGRHLNPDGQTHHQGQDLSHCEQTWLEEDTKISFPKQGNAASDNIHADIVFVFKDKPIHTPLPGWHPCSPQWLHQMQSHGPGTDRVEAGGNRGEPWLNMIWTFFFLPKYCLFLVIIPFSPFFSHSTTQLLLPLSLIFPQADECPRHNSFPRPFPSPPRDHHSNTHNTHPHPRHIQLCVHWTMAMFSRVEKMVTFQKNVPVPEPLTNWVALSRVGGREASPRQERIFVSLALNQFSFSYWRVTWVLPGGMGRFLAQAWKYNVSFLSQHY